MSEDNPVVVVLAGPNGSGKSTFARAFLNGKLGIRHFVNADVIAQGLSAFDPDSAAIQAGRIMLKQMKDLAVQRQSFAFESTLSSRSFAPWLKRLVTTGYEFHLIYFWLDSPDLAVSRVADRVKFGGHDVPDEVIRRRYFRSLRNFFEIYYPLASSWVVYNNTGDSPDELRPIVTGERTRVVRVLDAETWRTIEGVGKDDNRE